MHDCQETAQLLQTELVALRSRSAGTISKLVRDLSLSASKRSAVASYALELERVLREHGVVIDEVCF